MNNRLFQILLFILIFSGCQNINKESNNFTSSENKLKILTRKSKGQGVFGIGASKLYMKDTTEDFISTIIYPSDIKSIKRTEKCIDFAVHRFYRFKEGDKDYLDFLTKDISLNNIDTSNCLPRTKNYINIIEGYKNEQRVFIVDENNNKDLTDDSVRFVYEIDYTNPDNLVECHFQMYNGEKIVDEKSWLNIGVGKGGEQLYCGEYEHCVADFTIDKKHFSMAINDNGASDFSYDLYNPMALRFVLIDTQDKNKVYYQSDFLQLGEVFCLNKIYYRIEEISHNGGQLTLVKEKDFEKRIGTQIGMISPDFECISTTGDTIRSNNFRDKNTIIINMCGCGGDTLSVSSYKQIIAKYSEIMNIIGVDSQFSNDLDGILINSEDPFNKKFYENYRKTYCSRLSYINVV